MSILHTEGFGQEGAFEAACSVVAYEARGQETACVDRKWPVLPRSAAVSLSPSEDAVSHACFPVNHSFVCSETIHKFFKTQL